MPRLLLVDDNPSIHKIAETLLAATDIELVCLEAAEPALQRVRAGERFDVALLDTAMAGMDGWELLGQLRAHPATAGIPIAMMAGVLDTVDPEQIARAPIQGFLKKPVELRDLGDRVRRLLEEHPAASAADTIPAAPLTDLLPAEADLLVLGPEDLWVEAPGEALEAGAAVEAAEEPLELEELDLETLHGLQEVPAVAAEPVAEEAVEILPIDELEPLAPVEAAGDAWADEAWEKAPPAAGGPTLAASEMPFLVTADELPDLGDLVAAAEATTMTLEPSALPAAPPPAAPPSTTPPPAAFDTELSLEEELDLGPPPVYAPSVEVEVAPSASDLALPLAVGAGAALAGAAFAPSAAAAPEAPLAAPTAPPPTAVVPPPLPPPVAAAEPPAAWVQALLQDPQALDALAQALAPRLSDKALREVAWEVMPELAERLRR